MSDLGNIEPPYREGLAEKKAKNYLRAARWFRICYYYYEYGELPMYFMQLESYGLDAMDKFEYCKSKLTDEAQRMLEKEEREHYGDWREFIRLNYKKMDEEENMPSPNRPKEVCWLVRWFKKLF